jgi:hypothetical protein
MSATVGTSAIVTYSSKYANNIRDVRKIRAVYESREAINIKEANNIRERSTTAVRPKQQKCESIEPVRPLTKEFWQKFTRKLLKWQNNNGNRKQKSFEIA